LQHPFVGDVMLIRRQPLLSKTQDPRPLRNNKDVGRVLFVAGDDPVIIEMPFIKSDRLHRSPGAIKPPAFLHRQVCRRPGGGAAPDVPPHVGRALFRLRCSGVQPCFHSFSRDQAPPRTPADCAYLISFCT